MIILNLLLTHQSEYLVIIINPKIFITLLLFYVCIGRTSSIILVHVIYLSNVANLAKYGLLDSEDQESSYFSFPFLHVHALLLSRIKFCDSAYYCLVIDPYFWLSLRRLNLAEVFQTSSCSGCTYNKLRTKSWQEFALIICFVYSFEFLSSLNSESANLWLLFLRQ